MEAGTSREKEKQVRREKKTRRYLRRAKKISTLKDIETARFLSDSRRSQAVLHQGALPMNE